MKKLIIALLLALVLVPSEAALSTVGSAKSLSAVDSALTVTARGFNSISYQLTGTWSATVKFEGTVNGTTWTTVFAVNQKGGAVDSVATANGVYLLSGNGFLYSRARVSARSSGTVVVQAIASEGSGVVSLLNQTSAGAASNVAVTSTVLPPLASTSTKQSDGSQKTQIVDGSGNVVATTSNALSVNCTNCSGAGVAQGSTTSGQTGGLTQAAVTTAAPSYTTGQTSPLSLTTGGALRVDAGTLAAHPVTQSGTWTMQPGNTANTTAWLVTGTGGTFPVTDNSGSLTVDAPVGTPAFVRLSDGASPITTLPVSAASLPLPTLAATSTKQSDGTQKTQIVDGSGNVIASTSNNLNVQCANCSGSGASAADAASFTAGASTMAPAGAFYQTTATSNPLTNGQQGMLQATANRALHVNLRDASGNELSVGGGTQFAEDVASQNADVGTVAMAVRKATPANTSGTDGDYEPMQVSAGRLWVDASGKTLTVDGSGVTQPVSYATTGSGTATGALRVELPTNGTGTLATVGAVTTITNTVGVGGTAATDAAVSGNPVYTAGRASAAAPTDVSADGDVVPAWRLRNGAAATVLTAAGALIGGDATNGLDVDITRNAALVAGSAIIGKVGIDQTTPGTTNLVALAANQSVNVAQINGVTTLMGNGVTGTGSQRVTIASDNTAFSVNATATGPAAHDAAVSGNPVRLAGRAQTSDYTAVASGDVADMVTTIDGKQVVKPHAVRGATWTYAAASGGIVNTTAATMKAAAAAGFRNCLTGIQVINAHATVSTEVVVRDGAAGTVLHRGWAQAAGGGYAANFDVPICGTAATLMEVADITTGAAVYVNAQGYISQE